MRNDINDIIAKQPTQHSLDWYRARLGKFTGSQVGRLMKSGRGKDEYFGKDAIAYINEVMSERLLNRSVVEMDDLFEEYLLQVTPTSKAMTWGNDQEMNARGLYANYNKVKVTSCGAVRHSAYFASSPDGLVMEQNGCIEIKCPMPKTHTEYLVSVHNADELKAIKPEYYWQCMAHMACTGAEWCDWMSYCPFSRKPLHVVRIERNEDDIKEMLERIEYAAQMISVKMDEILFNDYSGIK